MCVVANVLGCVCLFGCSAVCFGWLFDFCVVVYGYLFAFVCYRGCVFLCVVRCSCTRSCVLFVRLKV